MKFASCNTALIIVDVQNDFISGSLALARCPAAEDGAEVVPAINQLLADQSFHNVVYTMDFHPPNHISFEQWPPHCVAGTWGAQFHPELNQHPACENILLIKKGTDQAVDSYSAFWDNDHTTESDLREKLEQLNIDTVLLGGIAFDICVYYTALDAAKAGFKTYILKDCCRGINLPDSDAMQEKMLALEKAGVQLITSDQVRLV